LGGEAYLNFIGNEFGHPEWLDFPRAGNHYSLHYARRQFNLVDDPLLRYMHLNAFDKAMHRLEQQYLWLSSPQAYISLKHEDHKVIIFERGQLLWLFNFHPSQSLVDYRVGTTWPGGYHVALTTDDREFGGHGRVDATCAYYSRPEPWHNCDYSLQVYLPCRTALVLFKDT
jgi:1,4-alpha-glucan branching enzyme